MVCLAALTGSAKADPPFPTPRPKHLLGPPAQAPAISPKPDSGDQVDDDPDPVLAGSPQERRERIRICGREWIEMKRKGSAYGQNWRDFSRDCFERPLPLGRKSRSDASPETEGKPADR